MALLTNIISKLAKDGITVTASPTMNNWFVAEHRGYTIGLSCNSDHKEIVGYCFYRTGIVDPSRTYCDNISQLLRFLNAAADSRAANPTAMPQAAKS